VNVASVTDQVRDIATRVASSYGLEIFDVVFRREGRGMILRVQVDRPGPAASADESVSVEDCARVSRDLSAILDVDDVIPTAYTLEVSSPGLDRPLRNTADYERFSGRRAKLVLRESVDGQMFFKGRLDGVEPVQAGPDGIAEPVVRIVSDDGRPHRVPVSVVTRANLEVEF